MSDAEHEVSSPPAQEPAEESDVTSTDSFTNTFRAKNAAVIASANHLRRIADSFSTLDGMHEEVRNLTHFVHAIAKDTYVTKSREHAGIGTNFDTTGRKHLELLKAAASQFNYQDAAVNDMREKLRTHGFASTQELETEFCEIVHQAFSIRCDNDYTSAADYNPCNICKHTIFAHNGIMIKVHNEMHKAAVEDENNTTTTTTKNPSSDNDDGDESKESDATDNDNFTDAKEEIKKSNGVSESKPTARTTRSAKKRKQ